MCYPDQMCVPVLHCRTMGACRSRLQPPSEQFPATPPDGASPSSLICTIGGIADDVHGFMTDDRVWAALSDVANTAMDLGGIASEIGKALPYVEHVVKILDVVFKVVQDHRDVQEGCLACTEKLASLKATLGMLILMELDSEHVRPVLELMMQLSDSVRNHNRKGTIRKFIADGTMKTTLEQLNVSITDALSALILATEAQILRTQVRPDPGPLTVDGHIGHPALLSSEVLSFSPGGHPQVVIIWGRGGMGKSTLARALYNERRSLPDFKIKHGAASVQVHDDRSVNYVREELLKELTLCAMPADNVKDQALRTELQKPKLLLLDNIWEEAQLVDFRAKLAHGSLIIVTTRNAKLVHGWDTATVVRDFPMPGLKDLEALALFRSKVIVPAPLKDLDLEIVRLCGGMPLALAIAGGGLKNKTALEDWEATRDALLSGGRIEGDGDNRMAKLLTLSLDNLKVYEKEMFLDACTVMHGREPHHALCVWQACHSGRDLRNSLKELEYRSLVETRKVDDENKKSLWVHDVLRALAGDEACATRVWKAQQKASVGVKAMLLTDMEQLDDVQDGAPKLQVLLMDGLSATVDISPVLRIAGTELKWLCLTSCAQHPLATLTTCKRLAVLELSRCSFASLPDSFGDLARLKTLILRECSSHTSLPESFGNLTALTVLDLSRCYLLESLPESFGKLTALTSLNLEMCELLVTLPELFGNLIALTLLDLRRCESLESLPESFRNLTALTSLDLEGCASLVRLPESFGNLTALTVLDLTECRSLQDLPTSFSNLTALSTLRLGGTALSRLADTFCNLTALTELDLIACESLTRLPESFGTLTALTSLDLRVCESLGSPPESFGYPTALTQAGLPESFGNLTALTTLDLSGCESLEELPESFGHLTALASLDLSFCTSLASLPESFGHLTGLTNLNMRGCPATVPQALLDINLV
eukprot:TRINITY_DN3808_c0_g1_i2.p1 TRINITY_DN3808_c0_g1~~TRINITY_DN3808_c0_g1_i2.p1  ORF type:complete len:941 (-),score=103.50 TRINITY_DN3808_c0_g1_i2:57-2879(-)